MTPEHLRLTDDQARRANWKRWGPYLADRQWGTVREDYSADGTCWRYFPHDHARSRAYRWGEDGLLGFTDRECRLCLAPALWNGKDGILKERLFGLTGDEGNHGEDVKECYYHLDATPTSSWCRALYRYPLAAFPYQQLIDVNRARSRFESEFELEDAGAFDDNRFVDLEVEFAKAGSDDLLLRYTLHNRSDEAAVIHLLPSAWYRNTWSWGCRHEGCGMKPMLRLMPDGALEGRHESLGRTRIAADIADDGTAPTWIFTENETNAERLFGTPSATSYTKDAFHRLVVDGEAGAVNPLRRGTKAAAWYRLTLPARGSCAVRLRVRTGAGDGGPDFGPGFTATLAARRAEADAFYAAEAPAGLAAEPASVARQAYAGLIWTRKFYHYIVKDWLEGDPEQPPPPEARRHGRNAEWKHLYNRDVISMPDGWEYPWYAAWDLSFHAVAVARIDPDFAKSQLELFLREWYLHPNGQIPAYEFALGDVNPPVHAWAAWRIYRLEQERGRRDLDFLERVFQKLLINFTWWVNRKDPAGNHLFAGGFLGLDNIGLFDRSKPLPGGGQLAQADGTAWMAFYAGRMLTIALELAQVRPVYEDIASKFLEHFVAIADAMNTMGGSGLWHEEDGFYYDQLVVGGQAQALRVRSLVGVIPLFASVIVTDAALAKLPGFAKRLAWFQRYHVDLAKHIASTGTGAHARQLLAIPSRDRLARVVQRILDPTEFLGPYGIRSLSRSYAAEPYRVNVQGEEFRIDYAPGESCTAMFGGNSNWRGPVWFPLNILLIEALERYHGFYGDDLLIPVPGRTGGMTLIQAVDEIRQRLAATFLPDAHGRRPCHGDDPRYAKDPLWKDLVLFHEYFHGDSGRGLGANHQTGWTALAAQCLEGRRLRRSTSPGH